MNSGENKGLRKATGQSQDPTGKNHNLKEIKIKSVKFQSPFFASQLLLKTPTLLFFITEVFMEVLSEFEIVDKLIEI